MRGEKSPLVLVDTDWLEYYMIYCLLIWVNFTIYYNYIVIADTNKGFWLGGRVGARGPY